MESARRYKPPRARGILSDGVFGFVFCLFLCPPGLQFNGPNASIYEARVPSQPLVDLASCPRLTVPSGGWSRILIGPPSRLNNRRESEVGGGKRAYRGPSFSSHGYDWFQRGLPRPHQSPGPPRALLLRLQEEGVATAMVPARSGLAPPERTLCALTRFAHQHSSKPRSSASISDRRDVNRIQNAN